MKKRDVTHRLDPPMSQYVTNRLSPLLRTLRNIRTPPYPAHSFRQTFAALTGKSFYLFLINLCFSVSRSQLDTIPCVVNSDDSFLMCRFRQGSKLRRRACERTFIVVMFT